MEELLAEYAEGKLTGERLRLLEARLKEDPSLMEEIELARFARKTLKSLPQIVPPPALADRIFERTTRRPAIVQRIAEWFRAIPAPAYALAMVAIIAGTVAYHQFGSTLKSKTEVAAISHRGLPQSGLLPVSSGLPPDTATIMPTQGLKVIQEGSGVEVHMMTRGRMDLPPLAPPPAAKGKRAGKDLEEKKPEVAAGRGGYGIGSGYGSGGGFGMSGATGSAAPSSLFMKSETKTGETGKSDKKASEPPPPPAPAPVSTMSAGGLYRSSGEDMPPFIEEDNNVRNEVADQLAADEKAPEFFERVAPGPAESQKAVRAAAPKKESAMAEQEKSSKNERGIAEAPTIIQRVEGRYSGWTREGGAFITSHAAFASLWNKIWSTRLTPPPLPVVNFEHQIVLGMGMGTQPTGGFSVRVESVRREGNTLFVEYSRRHPEEGSTVTESMTSPYSLVIIDLGGPIPADLKVNFLEK
jgi:hypothetical protein